MFLLRNLTIAIRFLSGVVGFKARNTSVSGANENRERV
jgi:hypothetical protein